MIDVKKLYFSYTEKPFVEDVSFHVGRGEIFGFLGPSGAGKSTIQKVLTGLNTKYKGSVKVAGIEIRERTNRFYENGSYKTSCTYIARNTCPFLY